jgi:hypothetical protein
MPEPTLQEIVRADIKKRKDLFEAVSHAALCCVIEQGPISTAEVIKQVQEQYSCRTNQIAEAIGELSHIGFIEISVLGECTPIDQNMQSR